MRGGMRQASAHDEDTLGQVYDSRLIRRLWAYVRPYKGQLLLSVVLLVAVSAAQLVQPYIVKLAIDGHITPSRLDGLGPLVLFFLGALVAEFFLRWAQPYVL